MDEQTQKIIEDQMKIIPEDVATAIISVEYQAKLQEIIKRQRLLIDQAGKLEMETSLVMIGLEPVANYTNNIQKELNINIIRAKEIAMDVNENIFKPVRESLQKMNADLEGGGDNEEGEKEGESEPEVTKFTNSNETSLNRDQILNEIENPILNHPNVAVQAPVKTATTQEIEIRPSQTIETIPGQEVKDIPRDIVQSKLMGTTTTTKQVVSIKSESKLPEVTKKSVDPYREPFN